MSNTSATGGYLLASDAPPLLSLFDFIQTVIVGISGINKTLVRPKWQQQPPKQPDIGTNWIAFGVNAFDQDTFAYVQLNDDGSSTLLRQEKLEVSMAFYGPAAFDNVSLFSDGCQITQNLEALQIANMGYNGMSRPVRGPDLINERWVDRFEVSLFLVRQVQRTYPILSFASASGTIHTVIDELPVNIDWEVEGP